MERPPHPAIPKGPVIRRALASLLAAAAALIAPAAPALDRAQIAERHFGNDAPWYRDRIPFFASADPKLDAVWYYRWSLFRAHQRDLGAEGYITTEFLDDVAWQRQPYASLNDASGFHIAEGRWLNDRRFTDDYIAFMYAGGNDRHFTDHMADSVWGRYLVDGDRAAVLRHLSVMRHVYRLWDEKYDFAKRLYFVEPLLDATEYTVSSIDSSGGKDGFRGGDAFRPSVNSYMFANARALANMARLAGDAAMANEYDARAEDIRMRVLADLWSPALEHFVDRYQVDNEHVKYWQPIRARELVGYLPWMFDLVPDDPRYARAWAHLLDTKALAGKAGMRTVEASYEYFMRQYRYLDGAPECQWNGPVWPYQTTQVLTAMANLLDHHAATGPVTRSDYMRLLRQYAALHYQGDRLDLEEDYHPETGKPIVGLDRSHHYFHSGFVDLVMTGLIGIRPRADDVLEVNPLLPPAGDPQALSWFRVENVPYHGHSVAVTWDADGRRFRRGAGLSIEVDGREVARRAALGRLSVPIQRRPSAPIVRETNAAVQLVLGHYPKPDASSRNDPAQLQNAIDGRVWFHPELPNGWTSDASNGAHWYVIDFGKPTSLTAAEIAFADDGNRLRAPLTITVEARADGRWQPVTAPTRPIANGVTRLSWPAMTTDRIRVRMTPRGAAPSIWSNSRPSPQSPIRAADRNGDRAGTSRAEPLASQVAPFAASLIAHCGIASDATKGLEMQDAQDEPDDGSDAAERNSERAEIHFLAALTDELMRTLMISGVLTQTQLNEIELAVAKRVGTTPRAW